MFSSIMLFQNRINWPTGQLELSLQFNYAVNQNLVLLPNESNSKVKMIELGYQINRQELAVKYFDARFRCLNRDGSIITEFAGNIINPVSGEWNGLLTKNTDLDFVLSSKKNFIEFNQGVEIGGFQIISASIILYSPSINPDLNFVNTLSIKYETLTNRNL
jgi:hypothetical protein